MARKPKWQDVFKAGQRYGKWEIMDPCVIFREGTGVAKVWAKCECGTKKRVHCTHLSRGNSKSCGCVMKSKGETHPAFKGSGDVSKTKYTSILRGLTTSNPILTTTDNRIGYSSPVLTAGTAPLNATWTVWTPPVTTITSAGPSTTVHVQLSPELLNNQLRTQQYSCSISGQPIDVETGTITCLNSSDGYVSGNIRWIRKEFKDMQGNMDFETFVKMCREVVTAVDKAREELKPSDNPIIQKANEIARKANERKSQ